MNVKTAILNVLSNCGAYSLFKNLLKTEVEIVAGGRVGDGEFNDALVFLKGKGWIDTHVEERTGDTRYFITNAGKTECSR